MPIERQSSVYVASVINHWLSAVPGRRQRMALLSLVLSTDSYSLKIALHYLRKVGRFQAILLRHPLPISSRTADTRVNHRGGSGGLWLLPFISGTWNNAIIYIGLDTTYTSPWWLGGRDTLFPDGHPTAIENRQGEGSVSPGPVVPGEPLYITMSDGATLSLLLPFLAHPGSELLSFWENHNIPKWGDRFPREI